jgi:excisionase family DNA binding protein
MEAPTPDAIVVEIPVTRLRSLLAEAAELGAMRAYERQYQATADLAKKVAPLIKGRITLAEAGVLYGYGDRTFRDWIKAGRLRAIQTGKGYLVTHEDVEEALAASA